VQESCTDADALIPDMLNAGHREIIVTPHAGEMKRLSGVEVPGMRKGS